MGNVLPPIDLGVLTASVEITLTLTGATSVLAGDTIGYEVDVQNTGERRLTQVQVHAPEVPDCVLETSQLGVGQTITSECEYDTTGADVPQKVAYVAVSTAQGAFDLSETRRVGVAPRRHRPDALLALGDGAFTGNGIYNTTGAGQSRATRVPDLGTVTFTVRIQNDGNVADTFRVKGRGATNRYAVTYRNGQTNVTAQVVAGTFTTGSLAPGGFRELRLTVKPKASTPRGATISRLTTITSQTDTTKKDAVEATVTRR
jgi:uncharacterized membrane protein